MRAYFFTNRCTGPLDALFCYKVLETIHRDSKQNMQCHGNYSRAGKFYYREMEMGRKGAPKKNRLWLELYHLLAGYEEHPEAFSIALFVVVFARKMMR